jgi:hypothetical protein
MINDLALDCNKKKATLINFNAREFLLMLLNLKVNFIIFTRNKKKCESNSYKNK